MEVLLLNMPFVSLARPAIGISLLKARLAEEGRECGVGYGSLLFAEWVGLRSYELVLDRISPAMFAGDWLFSQWLFPGRDHVVYLATLRRELGENADDFAAVLAMAEKVGPFLEACLDRFQISRFDIIGFTTTFEQNLASLALAKLIKTRYPEKTIVFGGGNCEGIMGLELHRRFSSIDYVCSGEADDSFPLLVERLESGQPPDGIAGVIHRRSGASCLAAAPDRVHDMDRLPDPNYDDYFAALGVSSLDPSIKPALLIESARGCWWGAKSHCTFCGLNGSTMAFRSKSAGRVYAELGRQKTRYGIGRFLAVDNIMSYQYFRDLLPMLKQHNPGISLFYEIKSNLKREQVELLRDAGVLALQPGIESLNSHVLRLMRKGVTAIQNVQLLRLCREYGIEIAWNLLYGFPGETPEDYAETVRVIAAISHLKPPGTIAPIRLDRFSPNYDEAGHFGLAEVKPFSMYQFLYPLPPESVTNLAYFFEYQYADGHDPKSYIQPVLDQVRKWKENKTGDLIKRYDRNSELMLEDTRGGGRPLRFRLIGIQREIYDLCDEIQSRSQIADLAAARGAETASVDSFLDQMVENRLMVREGNQHLSLAVHTGRRRIPQGAVEPQPSKFEMTTADCSLEIPPEIKASTLCASGGFAVIPGLFAEEDFQELVAEAWSARAAGKRNVLAVPERLEERGGSPCRAFTSAHGGTVQWRLFSAPMMVASLVQICGLSVSPTGGGSYTYYENAGDFLALHRDIITCDLALITCLKETAPEHQGGGLLVYPSHVREPLSSVRVAGRTAAMPVRLRLGDTIALLGGIVPHEVVPMEPRQERIVSVMCYQVLPVES